jgi:hypothetical protein
VNPPLAPADGLLVSPILDTAVLTNEPISPSSDGGPDDGKDVQR